MVDDIPENLELFSDVLVDEGYSVVTAESGIRALEILQKEHIDLIVADALMPKMDGLELCKRVRSMEGFATIPYIIYTGNYFDPEDQELAKSIGVTRYIMKTTGLTGLIEAIEELLDVSSVAELQQTPPQPIDEESFLERHHTIVTKKLEEKMRELEIYAETLLERNKELMISESRYRGLFEHAVVGIVVLMNSSRQIIDVNKQCALICGTTEDDIIEKNHVALRTIDGNAIDIFAFEEMYATEAILTRADGKDVYVEINAGPIYLPDDVRLTLLFLRDITEQKRLREQFLQNERMSTMGRIAAGIAHEIRNPLAGISLNLQFLDRKLQPGTPEHDSVTAALEGVQRIQQVIEDTLGLARVKPPSFRLEEIHPILEKTLTYLKLIFRQKSLTIQKQYAQEQLTANIDANQIQQVFLNILQNAADASPEGGTIIIATSIAQRKEEPTRQFVEIKVRDFGTGLSPEIQEHLFEPFHTTKSDGTGLGLMLSKYIIDRHHGSIEVTNADGGGTMVSLYLPQ